MPAVSSVNSIGLLLLRQAGPVSRQAGGSRPADADLVAAANGLAGAKSSGTGNLPVWARAKLSDSLFSVNSIDVNKLKIDLFERVGKKFGIDRADYASQFAYGSAIKQAIGMMKLQPGSSALADIEKDLGLDKLGISLDTVVNAIINPGGDDDDKLDAALRKVTGEDAKGDGKADGRQDQSGSVRIDDIGLYGFAS